MALFPKWKPKTILGKVLRTGVRAGSVVAATAFPRAASAVGKAATAFKAGVQKDTKKVMQSVEYVSGGGNMEQDFQSGVRLETAKLWIKDNLMLILAGVLGVIALFWFFGRAKKKSVVRRAGRRKTLPRSVGTARRKVKTAQTSGTFKRTIRGKTYTSRKAWAAEMQRLRSKK